MKKVIAFTIADKNNEAYLKMFVNSLRKFYTEEELPLHIVDQKELDRINDPNKFYRMTPMIARSYIKDYELVLKFDCDQIVCDRFDEILNDKSFDLGCVMNSNPKEPQIGVIDIQPFEYMNCGFVAMRNAKLVDHWWDLCMSRHFPTYQYREQDLMNIIYHYGNYQVKCFDHSDNWYGLVSKGWWPYVTVINDKLILKKEDRPWPPDKDKTIKLIHWAGGNDQHKMNYKLKFNEDVVKRLDYLVGDKK